MEEVGTDLVPRPSRFGLALPFVCLTSIDKVGDRVYCIGRQIFGEVNVKAERGGEDWSALGMYAMPRVTRLGPGHSIVGGVL